MNSVQPSFRLIYGLENTVTITVPLYTISRLLLTGSGLWCMNYQC